MTHLIYKSFDVEEVQNVLSSNKIGTLIISFVWEDSDEGSDYWSGVLAGGTLTDEVRKKLQRYLDKRSALLSPFRIFYTWLKNLI